MRVVGGLIAAALLAGCNTQSANMRVGTAQSLSSLEDQREAIRSVEIADALPEGAVEMSAVDASRCHRDFTDQAPSDDLVVQDLQVTAFGRGADGVHSVEINQTTGLLRNCWYTKTARGVMYRLNE